MSADSGNDGLQMLELRLECRKGLIHNWLNRPPLEHGAQRDVVGLSKQSSNPPASISLTVNAGDTDAAEQCAKRPGGSQTHLPKILKSEFGRWPP